MKRIESLSLVFVVVATLCISFIGCGNSSEDTSYNIPSETNQQKD